MIAESYGRTHSQGELRLGAPCVDATIRSTAGPRRIRTGKFPVDSGACLPRPTRRRQAFDSIVPREPLESIGLTRRGRGQYVIADGKLLAMDVTTAVIEFDGEVAGGTIVYGDKGAEPIVDVTALEFGGLTVNQHTTKKQEGCRRAGGPVEGMWVVALRSEQIFTTFLTCN